MKRSEMVSILGDLIWEHLETWPDGSIKLNGADKVLDGLVKAGMLPPTIENRALEYPFENVWEAE